MEFLPPHLGIEFAINYHYKRRRLVRERKNLVAFILQLHLRGEKSMMENYIKINGKEIIEAKYATNEWRNCIE